jgi:hypothetical protein
MTRQITQNGATLSNRQKIANVKKRMDYFTHKISEWILSGESLDKGFFEIRYFKGNLNTISNNKTVKIQKYEKCP